MNVHLFLASDMDFSESAIQGFRKASPPPCAAIAFLPCCCASSKLPSAQGLSAQTCLLRHPAAKLSETLDNGHDCSECPCVQGNLEEAGQCSEMVFASCNGKGFFYTQQSPAALDESSKTTKQTYPTFKYTCFPWRTHAICCVITGKLIV